MAIAAVLALSWLSGGCSPPHAPIPAGYVRLDELVKQHPSWIQADRMQQGAGVNVAVASMPRTAVGNPISMPDSLAADAASGTTPVRPRPTFNQPAFERVDEYSKSAQRRNDRIVSREQRAISKGLQAEIARVNESMQAVLSQFADRLGRFDKELVDLQLREISLESLIRAHEGRVKTEAEKNLLEVRAQIAARQQELRVAQTAERNKVIQHFADRREEFEADANRKIALRAAELQSELSTVLSQLRKQIASSLQPAPPAAPPGSETPALDHTPSPAELSAVKVAARANASGPSTAGNSAMAEEWRAFARRDTEARARRIAVEQGWQLVLDAGTRAKDRTEDVRSVLLDQWQLAFAGTRTPY